MKRTTPTPLVGLGVAGGILGFLLQVLSTGTGGPSLVLPLTFPITLVAVSAVLIVSAVPIWRATHATVRRYIEPFRASRIAMLAKACSLAGSLLTGFSVGVLLFALTRAVIATNGAVPLGIAAAVGSAILLAAGLVAEWMCMLPPDDDEQRSSEWAGDQHGERTGTESDRGPTSGQIRGYPGAHSGEPHA